MSQSHHESPGDVSSRDKQPQVNLQDDDASIHTVSTNDGLPPMLTHLPSHVSHTHDAPIQHYTSYVEIPDEIYDRLPHSRKLIIVALLSYCSFLAPISSTTILSAVPEVAATYKSTGTIINLSNALYSSYSRLPYLLTVDSWTRSEDDDPLYLTSPEPDSPRALFQEISSMLTPT